MRRKFARAAQLLVAVVGAGALFYGSAAPAASTGAEYVVGGWQVYEFVQPQPACTGFGWEKQLFKRSDCGFGRVFLTPATGGKAVKVEFVDRDGTVVDTQNLTSSSTGQVQFNILPDQNWDPGEITIRASVAAPDTGSAQTRFTLNPLEVTIPTGKTYAPGEAVSASGTVTQLDSTTCCLDTRPAVPATISATLHAPDGTRLAGPVTTTANGDGEWTASFPASATEGLQAGPETDFELELAVRANATYDDPTPFVSGDARDAPTLNRTSGLWAGEGAGAVTVRTAPDGLVIENSYVSSLGWVKPGDSYPFRINVRNETTSAASNAQVTIPEPDGVTFAQVKPLRGAGTASIGASGITWSIPSVGSGDTATLVVEAKADTLAQDPRIVWKDLSSTATLTYEGHGGSVKAESHGPKVIPPTGGFETARYGDKPFPIVPVDYTDRKHETRHSGDALARKVNSPNVPGSTYNLYQEMSYGQLHPFGSVPSVGIATAGWDYPGGFTFSERDVTKPTCRGVSYSNVREVRGTPLYPERIRDGWYQLPGDTEYYGGDFPTFTATSAFGIDAACGDTSKSVYDAAVIADPEIDYNKFDGDKDGVVDFFMMVFVGEGGNGASQLGGGYDNIWPHSSSLEFSYQDEATGLSGYISDDQLTDHEGIPQCWTDDSYSEYADCQANGGTGLDNLPTYVRVGPYNVNPETAIDQASVIAHEYGHHLGLPDFYSSYSAYGDWNLMATDHSQHMTVFGKQEMGWVVPEFLQPGETRNVNDWEEIKNDTGQIKWQTPQGEPYTLSAANGDQNVHNGQSYALKLPRKLVIEPQKVQEQTAGDGTNVWWSGRGNDFGCSPKAGHNLDIALPELQSVPEGTPVTVSFKSSFDIEWDFDYGFVLGTTDGSNYKSFPSTKGFTITKNVNPNNVACLRNYDNGLTGTSGAHAGGPAQVAIDRGTTSYDSGSPFVEDEYDISEFAGQQGFVLRLSYFTDPGLDRPGWFIDDLVVKAGDQVIYSSDFAQEDELRLFPGGCNDGRKVARRCTDGWTRIEADQPSELDHGYYLELRDRAGFDFEGRGEADRGIVGWEPGVLVEYTDEIRGYGNNGSSSPPRQHYIDSQPEPDYDCGNAEIQEHPTPDVLTPHRCQDAAFTAAAGDNLFRDVGWIDNFWDDSAPDKLWHFDYGCLTLNVTSMAGNTGNTEALPADLTANATITAGTGCSPFEYFSGDVNAAPTAVASANPKTAAAGETVTFSAAGSFDDLDPSDTLTYEWNFGDGSTATGATATHAYAAKGTYNATLTVTDSAGLSDTETVTVTVSGPDLQVTNLTTAGKKTVTITATVHNAGPGRAGASKTEFLLDGTTVLGVVDTPALAAGQSAQVSLSWAPKKLSGEHQLRATADKPGAIAEENEGNNAANLSVTVHGNQVENGDFEQVNSAGQPEAWSSQNTGAGTASTTSSGGTDGSNAAQMQGNGGNAATSGSPTWTSAPFAVEAGKVYDVSAAVKASGLSSAPSIGLVYLGAAGQVLDTVKVLTAPLQTDGFTTLDRSVTIPPLVTQVRVVLTGFAPTDVGTKGTVTFDDIGVYAR